MTTPIWFNIKTYLDNTEFEAKDLPDNLLVTLSVYDGTSWFVENVEGTSPEAKEWVTFITEWLGDTTLTDLIENKAQLACELAVSDWYADQADMMHEMEREGVGPSMSRYMHK